MSRAAARKPPASVSENALDRGRHGERVVLRQGNKAVAAVVPIADLRRLQKLEDEEDLKDIRSTRAEMERKGTVPWKKVKADLGLKWPMAAYRMELSPRAIRDLKKLPAAIQLRPKGHIDALAVNPRPRGVSKLRGDANVYRIRVGDYRVLFEIRNQVLLVIVLKVADRREAYRCPPLGVSRRTTFTSRLRILDLTPLVRTPSSISKTSSKRGAYNR